MKGLTGFLQDFSRCRICTGLGAHGSLFGSVNIAKRMVCMFARYLCIVWVMHDCMWRLLGGLMGGRNLSKGMSLGWLAVHLVAVPRQWTCASYVINNLHNILWLPQSLRSASPKNNRESWQRTLTGNPDLRRESKSYCKYEARTGLALRGLAEQSW